MANKSIDLYNLKEIRKSWKEYPIEVVPEDKRTTFLNRRNAVDMYIDGVPNPEIEKLTGIHRTKIYYWVLKCCSFNDEDEYIGYEALVHPHRLSSYSSNRTLFQNLLKEYPELEGFIIGNYFGDKKYTLERNMSKTTLHKKFLNECIKLGVQIHEYPFNTANKGYKALCTFITQLEKENLERQANRESKDNRQKLLSTGFGKRYTQNAIAPFACVQVDGHIIDMSYTVEIENNDGTIERKEATRAWVFAVIDVATRCILGYSVSQEMNYNQYDVIDAIYNAIVPHKRMELLIPGNKYPENGGYPSLAFPELKYPLFDAVMLDNAKSHLSEHTIYKIRDILLVDMNYGSVATPETRGIIERFFGTLENRGFHKLPMTTGSNPRDLKRRDPSKQAIKYHISFEQICEILEIMIAEYNNTPNTALNNQSPLECMRSKIFTAGLFPVIADDKMKKKIEELRLRVETRKVVGQTKNGKRPYINFMGAEYRGPILSVSGNYVGETIKILYDPRDISTLKAYGIDGTFIDTLVARGEFGTKSHSIKTRKMALALSRERGTNRNQYGTPIEALENQLMKESKKSRRAATRADIIRREQNKPLISEELKNKQFGNEMIDIHTTHSQVKLPSKEELDKATSTEELYKLFFGGK